MKLQRKIHKSTIPTGYKFLAIGGSGSGKNNARLNLINYQPEINKDPYKKMYW